MSLRIALAGAAIALAAAPAISQGGAETPPAAEKAEPAAKGRSCEGRKFEAVYEREVDGAPRKSRLTLCGKAGQAEADWLKTLTDAADKLRANHAMVPDKSGQVLAALDAEIAQVRKQIAASQAILAPPPLIRPGAAPTIEATSGYSTLPPMPPAPKTPPAVALAPPSMVPVLGGAGAAAAAPAPAPVLAAPRLTIRCGVPGEGMGVCRSIEPTTMFSVRADESLPGGVSLRFVRENKVRAEIALAQVARGRTVSLKTPAKLCSGVLNSSAEIQVVRRPAGGGVGQVVDSLGPFRLSC